MLAHKTQQAANAELQSAAQKSQGHGACAKPVVQVRGAGGRYFFVVERDKEIQEVRAKALTEFSGGKSPGSSQADTSEEYGGGKEEEEEDSKLVHTDAGRGCKRAGVRGHGGNEAVETCQPGT